MGLFRRTRDQAEPPPAPEQAVIVHLPLTEGGFGTAEDRDAIHGLTDRIDEAVKAIGGEYDGDEFGEGEAVLYTYGRDADRLFKAIQSCLEGSTVVRPGAWAIKRYGDVADRNARDERVDLA